ncbi:DUF504 domain-containing protein [archaeon]|nr:MAG: DUF504 domain-containing protein [archaeon]
MRAREMLNKLKWHPDYEARRYTVVYLHRGAPRNERAIAFEDIDELCTSDFRIVREDGIESYIPYHRVLRIEGPDGKVVWRKRPPPTT